MSGRRRRVVTGVSSVDYRLPLVRWAADEAAARGAELRLVTAVPRRAAPERYLPADTAEALRTAARARLTQAAKEASVRRPDLFVTTEVVSGPPAEALHGAAAEADLLVVGADDQSPFAEAISGSVPGALLTTSPCPIAVVPQSELVVRADVPVLVALDGAGTSRAALAYAFAAADRSGRALVALHCVPADGRDGMADPEQARALLAFDALYPDVAVTEEVVEGDPANVLTDRSRDAALLVLGSRGRGRLASGLFGSVSRNLIRRSGCPVVVARARAADVRQGGSP